MYRFLIAGLIFILSNEAVWAVNPLAETLGRIEANDSTLRSVRFYNFGEPANRALQKLFKAIETNTHVTRLEISQKEDIRTYEERAVHFTDVCLNTYKEPRFGTRKDLSCVKVSTIKIIEQSLKANHTLEELHMYDFWFPNARLESLGRAIGDNTSLRELTLGSGVTATMAWRIMENPNLQVVDFSKNLRITSPENRFDDFLNACKAHSNMFKLSLNECSIPDVSEFPQANINRFIAHVEAGEGSLREFECNLGRFSANN